MAEHGSSTNADCNIANENIYCTLPGRGGRGRSPNRGFQILWGSNITITFISALTPLFGRRWWLVSLCQSSLPNTVELFEWRNRCAVPPSQDAPTRCQASINQPRQKHRVIRKTLWVLESLPCISFLLVCEQNALYTLRHDICPGCKEIKICFFTAIKQAHDNIWRTADKTVCCIFSPKKSGYITYYFNLWLHTNLPFLLGKLNNPKH